MGNRARRQVAHGGGHGADVRGRRAAAAANDIHEAAFGEFAQNMRRYPRRFVIFAKFVGQPRIWVDADVSVSDAADFLQVRTHLPRAQGAVQPHDQRLRVRHRIPERFRGLPGEGAPAGVRDCARNHDRQPPTAFVEVFEDSKNGGFGVEGVENRLYQQQIRAPLDQPTRGGVVGVCQFVEGDVAIPQVAEVGGDGGGFVRGTERAGHEAGATIRRRPFIFVTGGTGDLRRRAVDLVAQGFHAIIRLRNGGSVEGVGLDDVRARFQIGAVNGVDNVRLCENEQVVVAFHVAVVIGEARPTIAGLVQLVALDHCAHGPIQNQNPPRQFFL